MKEIQITALKTEKIKESKLFKTMIAYTFFMFLLIVMIKQFTRYKADNEDVYVLFIMLAFEALIYIVRMIMINHEIKRKSQSEYYSETGEVIDNKTNLEIDVKGENRKFEVPENFLNQLHIGQKVEIVYSLYKNKKEVEAYVPK